MDIGHIKTGVFALLGAVPTTLALAGASLAFGFVLSIGIALSRRSSRALISMTAATYVSFFRSTPLLVQLFLIYYGLGQFSETLETLGVWRFFRSPWFCAILALTLNTAAYTAEIIRGGIDAVPKGVVEAGRALGLSRTRNFLLVVFPLAIRQALPGYGNEVIAMIKATSLASTITLIEITGLSRKLVSDTFKPLEVFLVAGSIYLFLNFIAVVLLQVIERRISRHLASSSQATSGAVKPQRALKKVTQ